MYGFRRLAGRIAFATALLATGLLGPLQAPPALAERPILQVVVEQAGRKDVHAFSRSRLEALGLETVRTTTPWTEGRLEFTGVSAARLMQEVGVSHGTVRAIALNDYEVPIPVSDFAEHDVLFALSMDGQRLAIRDKGPIWIVYPDSAADHKNDDIRARMVWQLKEIRAN